MSISMFDKSLPDEIILEICRYLSWFDIITAFYNLNSRLNRAITQYLQNVIIDNNCCLQLFRQACLFLIHNESCLFSRIRTLTISTRGAPLSAKYFLCHIPIQNMINLEKLTLIKFTGSELLSYLDLIDKYSQHRFQHLITLYICDPLHITFRSMHLFETEKEQCEYESNIINRVLTANNQRLQTIVINGDHLFMETNLNVIEHLVCINLHKLSIMLANMDDLMVLFAVVPNIRCLHVTIRSTGNFGSSMWTPVVLSHLVEFRLWTETSSHWTVESLTILLRAMPALQRLLLNILTSDARLLDGKQVQKIISNLKSLHLSDFNYAVEHIKSPLDHSVISNILQTWFPQPVALSFDLQTNELLIHTIPCTFHHFWVRKLFSKTEISVLKNQTVSYYGNSASMTHCYSHPCRDLNQLSTIMQQISHIKHLTFWMPEKEMRKSVDISNESIISMAIQQKFHITSMYIVGDYCENIPLIQLLVTFGLYLRRLHIDLDVLINLINDVKNNDQLKTLMSYRNLIYLGFDTIYDYEISSGAFRHVIAFLFNNSSSIRHITLVLYWDFNIFGSSDDMIILKEILSSLKHCTSIISVMIYHCLFSNKLNDSNQIMSIEDQFHRWLNDNNHLKFEQQFDFACDENNKTLKLWLK